MNVYNRFLVVGSGGREHAILKSMYQTRDLSLSDPLFLACVCTHRNPGISKIVNAQMRVDSLVDQIPDIIHFALENAIEVAIIGPEDPLEAGIVNSFLEVGISCIGPTMELANIETDKAFTRYLLEGVPELAKYNPKYVHFSPELARMTHLSDSVLKSLLRSANISSENWVIKAVGLKSGKGVKVSGDHFETFEEGANHCRDVVASDGQVIIEERLTGNEFSLISLCDGTSKLIHLPYVQDYKRANLGNKGPNTGGMGAIMPPPGILPPYLNQDDIREAERVNELVLKELTDDWTDSYVGFLYGSFMKIDKTGEIKVIEYNARAGDPEIINILHGLESDLTAIFSAMVDGELSYMSPPRFTNEWVVSRYICPPGYPLYPIKGSQLKVHADTMDANLIYASIESNPLDDEWDSDNDWIQYTMLGSRALAIVTSSPQLDLPFMSMSRKLLEDNISGDCHYRLDIGYDYINTADPLEEKARSKPLPKPPNRPSIQIAKTVGEPLTYRDAGVDIDEGNRTVDLIKQSVKSTHNEYVPQDEYGAFGGTFSSRALLPPLLATQDRVKPVLGKIAWPNLVASMDGVGTKVQTVTQLLRDDPDYTAFYNLGKDLFASNINDILCLGREVKPLFFMDYFGCHSLNAEHAARFVEGIAESCRDSGCVLLGGETAELPDFTQQWENRRLTTMGKRPNPRPNYVGNNWEMVGTIVGSLQPELRFEPKSIIPGDRVFAFRSSGPHTNGYSLINRLLTDGRLDANRWRRELTEPHINYYPLIQRIWRSTPFRIDVKALCHITGGGLIDNPPRVIPKNLCVKWKEWDIPPVFKAIQRAGGLSDEELVRTFNCGLGMLIVIPDDQLQINSLTSLYPQDPPIEVGTIIHKA